MKLTTIILTKNNESTIAQTMKSVSFSDETILIDDNSIDETPSIAKQLGAKVISRSLNQNFSDQRNFGLSLAKGEWVFFVDADEIVSNTLAKEITQRIESTDLDGFFLGREDVFMGKILRHGETSKVSLLRLAKKRAGKWNRPVHETWKITGKTSVLKTPLQHNPHQSLSQFFAKINYYTSVEAQYRHQKGQSWSLWQTILFPLGKFFQNYLLKNGFLDGIPGFAMAFIMSIHSITVRIKLYELCQKSQQ